MQVGDRQARIMSEQLPSNDRVTVVAAKTLATYERVVLVDTTVGAFTVTLPPVGESKGNTISIHFITDGGDCTISDGGDSRNWTDQVMTAVDDRVLLYSDGLIWWVLDSILT